MIKVWFCHDTASATNNIYLLFSFSPLFPCITKFPWNRIHRRRGKERKGTEEREGQKKERDRRKRGTEEREEQNKKRDNRKRGIKQREGQNKERDRRKRGTEEREGPKKEKNKKYLIPDTHVVISDVNS